MAVRPISLFRPRTEGPSAEAEFKPADMRSGRMSDDDWSEVQRAIERVVSNTAIGRVCDDVRPGYRKHAVGSHKWPVTDATN